MKQQMKFTKFTSFLVIGIVIVLLFGLRSLIPIESFIATIPSMTIPSSPKGQSSQLDTLNGNWRSILQYLSQNPQKSQTFIADMKEKFFADDCAIKQPRIDFAHLADSYRPVFT